VTSNLFIKVFFTVISDNEDSIKTREDTGLEVNLLGSVLEVIVTSKQRVSSSKYGCPGVQDSCDSSLSDGDGLLLHGFVDSNTVTRLHLIELINAYYSAVGQDHSSAFKLEFTSNGVFDDCCSETSS
jgi:hypothetical protein